MAYEVAIIGGGPIGIELAVALKKEGINYIHFEAGQIASTIDWYAPGTTFFSSPERISISGVPLDIPNQSKATREEYIKYLRTVVRLFNINIRTYEKVVSITKSNSTFTLNTKKSSSGVGSPTKSTNFNSEQKSYEAKKVVLAIGDMHKPALLNITGEDLPHVSHYFEDPHIYFNKKVLIVGGKNSAAEAIVRLYRVGCEVTLSYYKPALDYSKLKFWIAPEIKSLIENRKIKFIPNSSIKKITDNEITLNINEKEEKHNFDFVLLLTGYRQDPSLFQSVGINLSGEELKPEYNKDTMETNVKGVYVAGTACAGSQIKTHKEFIETSHVHVYRILSHITGKEFNTEEKIYELSES